MPEPTTPTAERLAAALAEHPDVARSLEDVHIAVWRAVDPVLLELARLRIAMLLGCEAELAARTPAAAEAGLEEPTIAGLTNWARSDRFAASWRACLEFVEQYLIDVANVTGEQTAAVAGHLGHSGLTDFASAVLVLEQRQRMVLTWDRISTRSHPGHPALPENDLLDTAHGAPPSDHVLERASQRRGRDRRLPAPPTGFARQSAQPWQDAAIAAGLDDWQNAVMRLDALDPVTTEVVRLRCATNHDCRFCRTVRLEVGGARAVDEDTAGVVARREAAALTPRHAAAMRLADAMMTQPGGIDDELVAELHRHFTAAELLEISLDVMKFSHQKIKVSLGLDEPIRPDGGLVDFAVDDVGRPTFGVVPT